MDVWVELTLIFSVNRVFYTAHNSFVTLTTDWLTAEKVKGLWNVVLDMILKQVTFHVCQFGLEPAWTGGMKAAVQIFSKHGSKRTVPSNFLKVTGYSMMPTGSDMQMEK